MALDHHWFTEIHAGAGTAFSLELGKKLHEEQTAFQKIEIYDTRTFGKLMVIDGCTMVSTRDNFFYHEMMSHPALFSHPQPKRAVIIGGGDCGTLREVLKHRGVAHVLQVEIDERVTRLAEKYFPELCEANGDPRAELYFGDGIEWVKKAKPGSVDLIIVDSTDPVGPAEGLFGKQFYADALRALSDDGLLVQQSESPLLHTGILAAMHQAMRETGFRQTHVLGFPQPLYPSGYWSASLAGKSAVPLKPRLAEIDIGVLRTRYYNAEIHQAAFALPPFVAAAIRG
ncbi:MAG: polyamine aminopropyltransferase [Nevskiales bacterium]